MPRSPDWSRVTALFGGTFDPPHLGHLEAVRGLFKFPGVGRVIVLPSPVPPHKPCIANSAQRIEMARLTFAKLPEVELDLRELERSPAYTFDTLTSMKRDFDHLAFVIGSDQLANLHTWHRFPEVLGLAHWIVLDRKPDGHGISAETLRHWEASGLARRPAGAQSGLWMLQGQDGETYLKQVPTDAPAISSTQIRHSIARTGQVPLQSLLPEVEAYLKLHRIYGMSSPS